MRTKPFIRIAMLAAILGASVATTNTVSAQRRISFGDAERIALRAIPSGSVSSIEHDVDRGRVVFEVDIRDAAGVKHELILDAETGEIIRRGIDND